jgi:hypothetical protein
MMIYRPFYSNPGVEGGERVNDNLLLFNRRHWHHKFLKRRGWSRQCGYTYLRTVGQKLMLSFSGMKEIHHKLWQHRRFFASHPKLALRDNVLLVFTVNGDINNLTQRPSVGNDNITTRRNSSF